jgi:hypothetical protein
MADLEQQTQSKQTKNSSTLVLSFYPYSSSLYPKFYHSLNLLFFLVPVVIEDVLASLADGIIHQDAPARWGLSRVGVRWILHGNP